MKIHAPTLAFAAGAALGSLTACACAETLSATTPRGAKLEVVADFPAGAGPFPTLLLAPGAGYHMALPLLEQTARRLVEQGIAVYRFNWAYFSSTPRGKAADDLAAEMEDFATVLKLARAEARVDPARLSVGGKSMGTVVAWRALSADKALRSGLFLTPLCSRTPTGQATPSATADETYPGMAAELRPIAFISGDKDPLCNAAFLYGFAAKASNAARVVVIGGDHSFENRALGAAAAEGFRDRNVDVVARLSANFITELDAR